MQVRPKIEGDYEDDIALARGFANAEQPAVRLVTTLHNQRLFRAAWAILRNRAEAEDAVQSAYVRAFGSAAAFEGRSSLTTWLTRIVINEALGRRRAAKRRMSSLDPGSVTVLDSYRDKMMRGSMIGASPDSALAQQQVRQLLERAISKLPEQFRIVFILREIEGLSVEEVAATLDISAGTVKTRDLRARRKLQQQLAPELKSALTGTFPFAGADCLAMTARVVQTLCSA